LRNSRFDLPVDQKFGNALDPIWNGPPLLIRTVQ
jgi:hypothetical protein